MRHQLIGFLGRSVQGERMINALIGAERHVRIGAVDRTRGRVNQVFHAVMAASFENVQKTRDVAADVYMRVLDRIADAGLGGKMDDAVKVLRPE